MSKIDDVLKDWGDRLNYGKVKGRKGRNVAGGRFSRPAPMKKPKGRVGHNKFAATIKKAPEVMVKISGGGKDVGRIKAHLDYISRNGKVDLEDEQEQVYQGKEDTRAVIDSWKGGGIPYEDGYRREAFNICLSMPAGTDRASVKNAAREFASEMFSKHQYVFAAHDDKKQPHVHLAVKAVDKEGVRLNPRKADLQYWREVFVEKLQEQGIEANATPRWVRGVVRKNEKQAIRHINQEYAKGKIKQPACVITEALKLADRKARTGVKHQNPAQDKINNTRKKVQRDFGIVARTLASGDEISKRLALDVVKFVQQMPSALSQNKEKVQQLNPVIQERDKNQNGPER